MKIGIVLAATPAHSETFFISKIKGLLQHDYEVVLFVNNHKGKFELCEVKKAPAIHGIGFLKSFFGFLLIILMRPFMIRKFVLQEKKSKVAFNHIVKKVFLNQHILFTTNLDWLHFGFATQAIGRENISKALGASMAISIRGFDIAIYPLKHPHCYDLLWERIDKLHVISNDLLTCALKNGFNHKTSYHKITPAIDVKKFFKKNQYEQSFFPKFLTVGRLHWKKGYTDTLLAFKILKDKGIHFKYNIIGSGVEYERIAYTIHDLNLKNEVTLLGQLTQNEIKKKLSNSDFYIQYSVQEGFCNAVLEAQSMGVLPIVSDAEGLPENVMHNKTGWVVPKCNSNKLAKQLFSCIKLLSSDKKEMQQTAKLRVSQGFNIEKQQQEFIEFYKF
tara:strand:- start:7918 stop:9081 length:1164 start_codon:yes stop_codon:yes gene_type:complete